MLFKLAFLLTWMLFVPVKSTLLASIESAIVTFAQLLNVTVVFSSATVIFPLSLTFSDVIVAVDTTLIPFKVKFFVVMLAELAIVTGTAKLNEAFAAVTTKLSTTRVPLFVYSPFFLVPISIVVLPLVDNVNVFLTVSV